MKNIVKVDLDEDAAAILAEINHPERDKLIEEHFTSLAESDEECLLAGFCTNERETYDGLMSCMDTHFEDEISGTLSVSFTGSAYFGCRDMEPLYEYDEPVGFEVDLDDGILTFTTETPDNVGREPETF